MIVVKRKKLLKDVKRVVIKIGSNLIVGKNAQKNKMFLPNLIQDIIELKENNVETVIVSSGAVGAGMHLLGIKTRPQLLPLAQACAAVGQNQIMQVYERLFHRHKTKVGQVLLTTEDIANRQRYFNLRHTINALLQMGVVPIINENDSIVVDEIKVGDNDTLSAHVTNFVEADLLIILSDIDGLYNDNPKINLDAELIYEVRKITPKIKKYCRGKGSEASVGGMDTKLKAAEIVTESGEMMIIANGYTTRVTDLLKGRKRGTLFLPALKKLSSRKRWIAFTKTNGSVVIDSGGVKALKKENKSLLPVGIKDVEGSFKKGDIILVKNIKGKIIARGISNYSSKEIKQIKGIKTSMIAEKLGYRDYETVIHRDNIVITNK